jgi:bifunctional enzyme CysN/CysC
MVNPAPPPSLLQDAALGQVPLRFLTCGSVDDGKSTLIGRLLYESNTIADDVLATLERDSRKHGTTGDKIDFALLLDGLDAEREQGITIDVAYRYFGTPRRSFIVADTPGHEQYTRNMATGASNCSLAVILVDARKGVTAQTRRHSTICSLFGIRHVLLAVNKLDLVGYSQSRYDAIVADYDAFSSRLTFKAVVPIPLSARFGDNITRTSDNMRWYEGPPLLEFLETVNVESDIESKPFRFIAQWINRPNADFRGIAGTVASGRLRPGDTIAVARNGSTSKVARIVTADGDREEALPGDAVTLTLQEEIDVARGDLLSHRTTLPVVADQFAAHVLWMSEEALLPGRAYLMRIGNTWIPASVSAIKHKLQIEDLGTLATRTLNLNEIGFCNLSTAHVVAFDAFADNNQTGAFILVDRYNFQTIGAGVIDFALRRATNIAIEHLTVDREARARLKGQKPCILWFTGLPGSGKSTIANLVEERLAAEGRHTYMLDGDNVRHGLNRDLGFTYADRVENIRRVGEVAKLFIDAGLIVLCAFISPFRAERQLVREMVGEEEFVEIFVDTPIEECVRRDPKGLYAKAKSGAIKNFTGFDSPYEAPQAPELILRTTDAKAEALAEIILHHLRQGRWI